MKNTFPSSHTKHCWRCSQKQHHQANYAIKLVYCRMGGLNSRNLVRCRAIVLHGGDNGFDKGLFQSITNCTHHQNTMPSHPCLLQVKTEYTRNKRSRCFACLTSQNGWKSFEIGQQHTTCYILENGFMDGRLAYHTREWVIDGGISLVYKRMGHRWPRILPILTSKHPVYRAVPGTQCT